MFEAIFSQRRRTVSTPFLAKSSSSVNALEVGEEDVAAAPAVASAHLLSAPSSDRGVTSSSPLRPKYDKKVDVKEEEFVDEVAEDETFSLKDSGMGKPSAAAAARIASRFAVAAAAAYFAAFLSAASACRR
jgi:hypothetical protein